MKRNLLLVLCGTLAAMAAYSLVTHHAPIRVGFVSTLTKGGLQLGPAGLNGATLAVEEINKAGGIDGHLVELLVEDDGDDHDKAWNAVSRLIDAGSVAIIGHMTSEMSFTTSQLINEKKVLMLSPTTATEHLSAQGDYFLRIYPSASVGAQKVVDYAIDQKELVRLAVIFDRSNFAFTESWKDCFVDQVTRRGRQVGAVIPFDSGHLTNGFSPLVQQIVDAHVDGVLILANPQDTAMLCQQFAKLERKLELFASEWSYSPNLYQYGGESVEDLNLFRTYLADADDFESNEFSKRYSSRFGEKPWFAAVHSYDAMHYLFSALQRDGNVANLKQTLINYGAYQGVQSSIKLDRNGDADRIHYVRRLKGGKSELVAQI